MSDSFLDLRANAGAGRWWAMGKCVYMNENAGFAKRFPLGLLDTEGLELSFQDLYQSNHFKNSLSLNKQRKLKAGFLGRRRGLS